MKSFRSALRIVRRTLSTGNGPTGTYRTVRIPHP